jgi:hypothetical protein
MHRKCLKSACFCVIIGTVKQEGAATHGTCPGRTTNVRNVHTSSPHLNVANNRPSLGI